MTIKQRLVLKKIVENPRKSISGAMREVGYSSNTAVDPGNLTRSKGWKELMEQFLPDDKLLTKHNEAMEATKWNDFTGDREEDHAIRLRAVELGYKLKRHLGPEIVQQFNSEQMDIEFISTNASSSPSNPVTSRK